MKMRKPGIVALSVSLAAGILATGCASDKEAAGNDAAAGSTSKPAEGKVSTGAFPIVKEPITLKMFARKGPTNGPFKDMPVFQEMEKLTNIKLEIEDAATEGFAERRNLLFAANELPDFFFKAGISPLDSVKYGTAGQLIPLENMIDKYAPNFKKLMDQYPEIRPAITTPEGHIYVLPGVVTVGAARTNKKWINKDWLDKLGLKVPTTTDELVTVLRAFRDKDPNGNGKKDEIPMTARKPASEEDGIGAIVIQMAGSWGLDRQFNYNINLVNDKVKIWVTDDKYKSLLEFLNMLYKEKLLDNEIFSHNASQYVAKMSSGNAGYFFDQTDTPFKKVADKYVGSPALKGPFGDQMYTAAFPLTRDYGAFAITKVNKNPEATLRWIDHFYGEEGSTLLRFGLEGKHFIRKDGEPVYVDEILNVANSEAKITPFSGGGAPHLINEKVDSFINPPRVQEAQKLLDPYMPKVKFGPPVFDEATSAKFDQLRTDIDTFVTEQSTKFIVGALSFDKWSEYVSTLQKMNMAELEKIYQQAYDKTKKK
jgi:putative aldouronate transport system substrate-binding protein